MTVYNNNNSVLIDGLNSAIRINQANLLMKNIGTFNSLSDLLNNGAVCHDAAALIHFLKKPHLSAHDLYCLKHYNTKEWIHYFYTFHTEWDGISDIPAGKVIGFFKDTHTWIPMKITHSAIAVGGTKFRGINGKSLGESWSQVSDLKTVLTFTQNGMEHDGTIVKVLISDK